MISNPYCPDIQIWKCEWSQGYKMTQNKLPIKNSKLFYMYAALFCWQQGPPEVDLNLYSRICDLYSRTIKFCRCEWAEDLLCYKK